MIAQLLKLALVGLTFVLLATRTDYLAAQTTDPAKKSDDAGGKPTTGDRDSSPAEKKSRSIFDSDFLKKLLGGLSGQDDSDEDPLERAIQQMRSAQKRIEDGDTGQQTRDIQKQIVKDLEKLIELAKQQPNQSSPSPMPKNDIQKQQPMPKGSSKSDQGDQKDKEKPQDSDERADKNRESEAKLLARRTDLIKDVWGHLPPALREKMLNIYSEKYLPRYEELVRRYFEALAEQGRQTRSR